MVKTIQTIFQELEQKGVEEVGFVDPVDILQGQEFVSAAVAWIQGSRPTYPRTVWFTFSDSAARLPPLPSILKSRLVWMPAEALRAWAELGPFPALVTRSKDLPPFVWSTLHKSRGSMELEEDSRSGGENKYAMWFWKSVYAPRRALMICHHCGVLPDLRRQLLCLGVKGEFVWLCDGKPQMGDAWSSTLENFTSSVPLLRGPLDGAVSESLKAHIRANYDMICTSHCMRYPVLFAECGLPLLHVNSTRFGNEITCRPAEFADLKVRIGRLLASEQLTVVHNNAADAWYAQEYLGAAVGDKIVGSLCDQPLRFRISAPAPVGSGATAPYLLWDTRFHLQKPGSGSPLLHQIRERLGNRVVANSELSVAAGKYLDDDMLHGYKAVIHIPYNISTMSCFEQASANIPIWVPTPRLLKEILNFHSGYNELSWYCFNKQSMGSAERPDRVWESDVLDEYVKRSDFQDMATGGGPVLGNLLFFDSVDDLLARIDSVDYDAITKRAFQFGVKKKADCIAAYEKILAAAQLIRRN